MISSTQSSHHHQSKSHCSVQSPSVAFWIKIMKSQIYDQAFILSCFISSLSLPPSLHLLDCLSFSLLLSHRPSPKSSNIPGSFLPQGLCTCMSFCQECFPHLLSHLIRSCGRGLSFYPVLDNVICSLLALCISYMIFITSAIN